MKNLKITEKEIQPIAGNVLFLNVYFKYLERIIKKEKDELRKQGISFYDLLKQTNQITKI